MQTARTRTTDGIAQRLTARAAALALLSFTSCATEGGDDSASAAAAQETSGAALDAGAAIIDASGSTGDAGALTYTAEVTASGTGCPAGTWQAKPSDDNRHFAVTFDGYEVAVDGETSSVEKDCRLTLKLRAQSGASFAMTNLAHTGYAYLEKGVQGKQTSTAYFESARITSRSRNSYFSGPFDDAYRTEPLEESDQFWTPCALEQSLLIISRLQLRSDGTGAKGLISAESALDDGFDMAVDLAARPCTLPPPR